MDTTPSELESDVDPGSLVIPCPQCQFPLEIHQPDPTVADRLLATCSNCDTWFVTNSKGDPIIPLRGSPDDGTVH